MSWFMSDQGTPGRQENGSATYVVNEHYFSTSKARHLASIAALCDEFGCPFDELALAYECELVQLAAVATVMDYLPVLASKKVRTMFLQRAKPALQ